MWEGFYINYRMGKTVCIGLKGDHARWIYDVTNASELGVVIAKTKFNPIKDRDKYLLHVLRHSPVMRVRGHGVYVTAEFNSKTVMLPYVAVNRFAKRNLTPIKMLHIVNWAFHPPRVRDVYALFLGKYVEKRGWTDKKTAKRDGKSLAVTAPASPSCE